jgi:hypothetical protein
MPYEYEQVQAMENQRIGEVYVVRGVEERLKPSQELLAALERLSSTDRTLIQRLVSIGFEAMVRK